MVPWSDVEVNQERIQRMKPNRLIVLLAMGLLAIGALGQKAATDQSGTETNIALLRSDVQAQKTDIIAHTIQLTDAQGKVFWPLYRKYANRQQIIGDDRANVIKDYAEHYESIDDAKADELMGRMLKYDQARAVLRTEYYPKFKSALGAKQAAKFLQVDNRLTLIVDLQIAAAIPIIE